MSSTGGPFQGIGLGSAMGRVPGRIRETWVVRLTLGSETKEIDFSSCRTGWCLPQMPRRAPLGGGWWGCSVRKQCCRLKGPPGIVGEVLVKVAGALCPLHVPSPCCVVSSVIVPASDAGSECGLWILRGEAGLLAWSREQHSQASAAEKNPPCG